jgi:hypothetical protein
MKLKIKKYIYLVNDVTNMLLAKDREEAAGDLAKMKKAAIILAAALAVSLALNVYLIIKYV